MSGPALPWPTPEGGVLQTVADVTGYLFLEDPPQPVDVVLVFGGGDRRRALPAIELYRLGLARRVIVSGGPPKGPTGFRSEAEAMAALLEAAGIPLAAISVEPRATNTLENVRYALPLLEGAHAVALATKPVHMRRAAMTARRHLPRARLVCRPAPLRPCSRGNWWQRADWRATVADELAAIACYAARGDIVPL